MRVAKDIAYTKPQFQKAFETNPKNNFWVSPNEIQAEKVFASTYASEDLSKISQRTTEKQNLVKVDIRDLFRTTLYNTKKAGAWGLNEHNEFLPLKNRYEFVEFVLKNQFSITDEQIQDTEYYKLLSVRDLNSVPRDGSSQGVYAHPLKQAKYFCKSNKKKFGKMVIMSQEKKNCLKTQP